MKTPESDSKLPNCCAIHVRPVRGWRNERSVHEQFQELKDFLCRMQNLSQQEDDHDQH